MSREISVAMAVCNGERFIAEQLDSIVHQSLPPDEIIICDDSATDGTFKAIAPFLDQYPEVIKYRHNEKRLGVSKNFERAVSMTSGKILFLSDQDDVWALDKIRRLATLIHGASTPIGAFCNSALVDEHLVSLGVSHWDLREFNPETSIDFMHSDKAEKFRFFCRRVPAAGHNMAFSAKFKEILLPFPDLPECHDTWIGLMVAAVGGWSIDGACLTKFRQHHGNVSQAGRRSQLQEAIASLKNDTFNWYVALFDELTQRLTQSHYSVEPRIMALVKDRREHSSARAAMNCNILKRLPLVLRELLNQRYFKYARGWKSVLQDLLLRTVI